MARLEVPLTEDDIIMLLDCINAQMTEKHWRNNKRRADKMYELYQSVGQALGETNIVLGFTTDLN